MKCVNLAVNAVVTGEADVLMKGLVSTDKYMRGILNKDAGLFPPKGTLSHVAVVEMPNYPKLLVISDVAVIPQPDFKQKTILIGYLTRIANLIGIKTPKIACIAPSEQLLPSVLSSTEADCLLFHNIESGNVFFKASTHMGGGELAALVMGTKVPCVLTSRGDSSLTKLYSIALACLAAK